LAALRTARTRAGVEGSAFDVLGFGETREFTLSP
jgi:hypothetical protein